MSGDTSSVSRRAVLGSAAVALGLGVAAGAAVATPKAPPVAHVGERRRFRDKVVLITGATSGIGAAAARMFAAEGGRVAFCGRRVVRGRDVERGIREAGGEATYIRADVRREGEVKAFIDATVEKYGGLDVCFNNAGATIEKPLVELSVAEWEDVVNTDLRGNFLALKYEIPHLIARGGGSVVVTSSSNAVDTRARRGAYTAAKRGLVGRPPDGQGGGDRGIRSRSGLGRISLRDRRSDGDRRREDDVRLTAVVGPPSDRGKDRDSGAQSEGTGNEQGFGDRWFRLHRQPLHSPATGRRR